MNEMKVSILLAVYNGEKYIKESIESVINQDYTLLELIIANNGSTDNTERICKQYIDNQKIKYIYIADKNKNNAFNIAFNESSGDYICFLAADDKLPETSISKRVSLLNNYLDYSTCVLQTFSNYEKYNNLVYFKNKPNFSGGSLFFSRYLADLIFPIPTCLPNEDTWVSIHLKEFGNLVNIQEILYFYRIHDSNSYGYHHTYEEKRNKFIQRMKAYSLFIEKQKLNNFTVSLSISSYAKSLKYMEEKKSLPIFFMRNISFYQKIVLIYFNFKLLYKVRNMLFNLK